MITRRELLKVGAVGLGAVALGCDPGEGADAGIDAGPPPPPDAGIDAGQDAGADAGPPLRPLAIPPLVTGTLEAGVRTFDLEMRTGSTSFSDGVTTETWGYEGDFLGPALALRRGEEVALRVTNHLPRPTTTHWHGLHLPAEMDGGPHPLIDVDATWTARFRVENPASLCWFHPHPMGTPADPGSTSYQVYMGLAGLLYVSDDESDALALPRTHGVDNVPLVLMDRRFAADGSFHHFDAGHDAHSLRKGDTFLVNGVITPAIDAPAQQVRLRVLNGSNARLYHLAVLDEADRARTFAMIASDSGLLAAPVPLERLVLAPGERAELVVDLAGDRGRTLRLVSKNEELNLDRYAGRITADEFDMTTVHLATIRVGAPTMGAITTIPSTLAAIERIPEAEAVTTRVWQLGGPSGENHLINGRAHDMTRTDAIVPLGDTEIWEIQNATQMAHPFHIHGAPFQVLSRTNLGMDGVPDEELGWKDTVLVRAGEIVRVIKRHLDYADPVHHYMFHCHLLEHEDRGMMGQFTVV